MTSICRVLLPESILNEIFEYLSHITDSGWILRFDRKGKLRLIAQDKFTPNIDHINFHKRYSTWYAGRINLIANKCGANSDLQPVVAISQPLLSSYESVMYANYAEGFYYRNMCIQYDDPETGSPMVAYVDLRVNHNHAEDEIVFHQGCVYDDKGNSFVITGYGSDASMTRIAINPFNMIWDTVGDDTNMWDEIINEIETEVMYEIENGDELNWEMFDDMIENGDDFDLDAQPPLDMYM